MICEQRPDINDIRLPCLIVPHKPHSQSGEGATSVRTLCWIQEERFQEMGKCKEETLYTQVPTALQKQILHSYIPLQTRNP